LQPAAERSSREHFVARSRVSPIDACEVIELGVSAPRGEPALAAESRSSTLLIARSRAAKELRPASSAVSGKVLKRQLASEAQMAERGTPIFGPGTARTLRDARVLRRPTAADRTTG
jgi:hypothetical protein